MSSTIADVSKLAGCSPATVSRVLNNSGAVSRKTREAVLRSARDLGYSAGLAVKERKRTGSNRISGRAVEIVLHCSDSVERVALGQEGVEVESLRNFPGPEYFRSDYSLTNSFHRELISGIVDELGKRGLKAVLQIAANLADGEFLDDLNSPDKMGILLLGEPMGGVEQFCDRCIHPLVLVDIMCRSWPDVVTIDNAYGMSLAVKHLVSLGHRDIGFVGWAENENFRDRRAGFVTSLFDQGITFRPEWSCEATVHIEEKAVEVARMLSKSPRPTAIVCCNDFQALSVIRAATRLGFRVPQDLSVVGFDDVELSRFVNPALTTVRVPIAELGRVAVRQLLLSSELVDPMPSASRQPGVEVRIRPEFVRRESTADASA
jgi:DNA-binding LacI/PurR family transcriptional regulator